MVGDVHLGDWGLQMGLIITELRLRQPDLCYFDPDYTGEYPSEPPFTISELEEIYPTASAKSKEDAAYKEEAMTATFELQQGNRGYQALLKHILDVSVSDLKKNYENLNVSFELWKGESDAQPYIPDMVEKMKKDGYAYVSDGALVVDVKEDTDTKEIPPCMILKSDGASLYDTTDLAYGRLSSGECDLSGRQASGVTLCPGIPLCKKDRYRTGYDRTQVHRFWYHERQGRQAFQDKRRRRYASGDSGFWDQ